MITELIALAKTQLGIEEDPPGSNSVVYNKIYYGSDTRLPWCVVFIWWLFDTLGASNLFCGGQKTAYVPFVEDYAKKHNQWVSGDYKPGDLCIFNWDGGETDHIGLIIEVNGNSITTIEGNCNDKVSQMMRGGITLVGAYRPNYPENLPAPDPVPEPEPPKGENPGGQYIVQKGDTLWGIAEKFYGKGQGARFSQIMSANNLMDTLIHPGQVLVIPDGDPFTVYRTIQITVEQETLELLTIMAEGWGKTIGQVVDKLMEDAK